MDQLRSDVGSWKGTSRHKNLPGTHRGCDPKEQTFQGRRSLATSQWSPQTVLQLPMDLNSTEAGSCDQTPAHQMRKQTCSWRGHQNLMPKDQHLLQTHEPRPMVLC